MQFKYFICCSLILGCIVLLTWLIEILYVNFYNNHRKNKYGKPDSICEHCRAGVKLSNNMHKVVSVGGFKLVICKERLRQIIQNNCGVRNK